MTRRSQTANEQRRHDRSAVIQWVAIGLLAALGLLAAVVLTDSDRGGAHLNAPPTETFVATT